MQVVNVINEQSKTDLAGRGITVPCSSYAAVSKTGSDAVSLLLDGRSEKRTGEIIGYTPADMVGTAPSDEEEVIPGDVASEEDEEELKDEGFSPEKLPKERLERAIARIKEGKAILASSVESRIEEIDETSEEMEEIGFRNRTASGRERRIAQLLREADVPVTKESIEGIERSIEMMSTVSTLSESSMAFLMSNDLKPTVGNVYTAVHAGVMRTTTVSEAVMKSLSGEFDKVLDEAEKLGAKSTAEDIRMLMSHDIPVTAQKLLLKDELSKLAEEFGKGFPAERVADACVAAIAKGKPAEEGVLTNEEEFNYRQLLRKMIPGISKARELQEARLRLTVESGMRLYKEGIRVDTDGIERVVEGLKNLEKEFCRHCLTETGEPAKEEDAELLSETFRVFEDLRESPEEVLGARFKAPEITANELAFEGRKLQSAFAVAGKEYEKLQTSPRADLGDSLRKAFGGIDSLLESIGLDTDEDNRRAVKILGYNSIEINEKNISIMKEYDAEVRLLMDRMKPGVAAELIRRGIDPVNTPIAGLSEQLRTIDEELGVTPEERYAEFLVKAERSGSVTPDEREAFIGIYRLMYQIEKSDGAAIGAVVEAGAELTLANLMNAVRTRKSGGIDERVDREFGVNQGISARANLFTTQIEDALTRIVSEGFGGAAGGQAESSDGRTDFGGAAGSGVNAALSGAERSAESLALNGAEHSGVNAALNGEELSDELLLLKEAELPDSLSYAGALRYLESESPLLAAGRLMPKRPVKGLQIREISGEDVDEAWLSRKSDDIYDNLVEEISEEFEEEDLTPLRAKALLDMRNMMSLMPKLAERGYYELPVETEEGTVIVNLTLEKGSEKGLDIRLTGEEYGVLEIGVKFEDAGAELIFSAQTKRGEGILARISREARGFIEARGYRVRGAATGRVGSRDAYIEKQVRAVSEGAGSDTGDLVTVAKGLISMTVRAVTAADGQEEA